MRASLPHSSSSATSGTRAGVADPDVRIGSTLTKKPFDGFSETF